jgi:hypothetical protein
MISYSFADASRPFQRGAQRGGQTLKAGKDRVKASLPEDDGGVSVTNRCREPLGPACRRAVRSRDLNALAHHDLTHHRTELLLKLVAPGSFDASEKQKNRRIVDGNNQSTVVLEGVANAGGD